MKNNYKDVISGLFIMAISSICFYMTFFMKRLTVMAIGPEFMPRLVFGLMFVLGAIVFISAIVKLKKIDKNDTNGSESEKTKSILKTSFMTLLLMVAYALCLAQIGFLITTAVYLFFQIMVLCPKKKRKPLLFGVVSIVTVLIVYFTFRDLFQLMLPEGILG